MKKSMISIILPVYNSEKTIKKTLKSLLNQKYKNYEVIIINDGSTDKSGEICKKYSNKYNFIKYYSTDNYGVSHARNYGILKSSGEYIMFIDSDDEYMSHTLLKISENLHNDVDLIVFGYERIHVNKNNKVRETSLHNSIVMENDNQKKDYLENLQKKLLFNQIWNKVYKKSIILKHNIRFNEDICIGEDYRFNITYLEYAQKSQFLNELLYKYYSTSDGLSLKNTKNKMYVKLQNIQFHKEFYKRYNYDLTYINTNYVYECFSVVALLYENKNLKNVKEALKEFIENKEIHQELKNIKKTNINLKLKILTNILLIKNIRILQIISKFLYFLRKIYRRIKLG